LPFIKDGAGYGEWDAEETAGWCLRKYLEGIVVGASANRPEGEGDRGQAGEGGGSIAGLPAFSM